jgi:hypothetical protein
VLRAAFLSSAKIMLNVSAAIPNYKHFVLLVVESDKNAINMTHLGLRGGFHVDSV